VVIHESMHAYITWSCLSFAVRRNGVDVTYLKRHFRSGWLRLLVQPFPDNEEEHSLMSENFAGTMIRCLYPYTNPGSDLNLRDDVARALTWGGLFETPKGKTFDNCYYNNIDIWARNIDADSSIGVRWAKCSATGAQFLHSLELQTVCK
jgi:hypothetical protein